ncbi:MULTISPECIES: hypothetical protein [unclassified Empedobacter]|nr:MULTISPECIES: hypothetical protein [unclassified Empedobacter]MDM1138152.1 hypothetical protein [Empedobacter sp. R132-2]
MNNLEKLDEVVSIEIESLENRKWYKYEFNGKKFKIRKNDKEIKLKPYVSMWIVLFITIVIYLGISTFLNIVKEGIHLNDDYNANHTSITMYLPIVFNPIVIYYIIKYVSINIKKGDDYTKLIDLLEKKGYKIN